MHLPQRNGTMLPGADQRRFQHPLGLVGVGKVRQRTAANTVAVVGRSGSGKSSVVFAGLFPVLRREKGLPGQAVWDILSLRPRDEPLHQLAHAFAPPAPDADPIARPVLRLMSMRNASVSAR